MLPQWWDKGPCVPLAQDEGEAQGKNEGEAQGEGRDKARDPGRDQEGTTS
jgi:hypothetical protein